MNVVNYNQAAKIAGVSRQRINTMRNQHKIKKKNFPFFIFDPLTANPGIDIENTEWIKYVGKSSRKRKDKHEPEQKEPTKQTELSVTETEQEIDVDKDNLLKAVVLAIREKFKLSGAEMDNFLKLIEKKYDEVTH